MGDRLTDMAIFARVARLGGFSAASREMGFSTTAVSRRISELEEALGVRLLNRTTRQTSLTPVGRAYLERCERILDDVDQLEDAIGEENRAPRGLLRVAAGVSFAQEHLTQLIPEFLGRYDQVSVELELSDRHVDLVSEGIDVALRVGALPDSTLIATRLAGMRLALVASPDYIREHGKPRHPRDLDSHHRIVDRNQLRGWTFAGPDGPIVHTPEGRFRANSAHAALEAAARGLGIALSPTFVSGPSLLAGRVVQLLPEFEPEPVPISVLYPENRYLTARVRVFVDFLKEKIGDPPVWDAWAGAGVQSDSLS